MELWIFLVLALVSVVSALIMVTSRSVLNSVLSLVVTMFAIAGFYIMLKAPFMAAVQLIVYAGAIMVLFLFVIMLLDLREFRERLLPASAFRFIAAGITGLLCFVMSLMAGEMGSGFPEPATVGTIEAFGKLLFSRYFYLFELASILLMAALVGAVLLARKPEGEES